MKKQNASFLKSIRLFLTRIINGRMHFSKEYSRKTYKMDDGKKYRVLRDLRVAAKTKQEESLSVFKVSFRFSGLPMSINKKLSMIPAPFLMSMSGFREKIWTVSEDGYFQGLYEWSSKEYAEAYPKSFIFKLMTKRSAANSLSYEIIPNKKKSDYINTLV